MLLRAVHTCMLVLGRIWGALRVHTPRLWALQQKRHQPARRRQIIPQRTPRLV